MQAEAIKDFSASMSGRDLRCKAGDVVEADAKTIEQLEAIGLVSTGGKEEQGDEPGEAGSND